MGKIKKILENELVGGTQTTDVYPVTSTKAVYDENNERLDKILGASQEKLTELETKVIYDVTANNDGATFASLSALLSSENLSTLIPIDVRCGGMSIRFIQSSDNKYVQYRLMDDSFSTTEADWQGVDDEPTVGSDNLVRSGGVYNRTSTIHGYDTENSDLEFSDENNNCIVEFKDGHIKTKNFDSANIPSIYDTENYKNIFKLNKYTLDCVDSKWNLTRGQYISNGALFGWSNKLVIKKENTINDKVWIFDFSADGNGIYYFGSCGSVYGTTNGKQSLFSVNFSNNTINIHNYVENPFISIPTIAKSKTVILSTDKKYRVVLSRKNRIMRLTLLDITTNLNLIDSIEVDFGISPSYGLMYDMPCCFSENYSMKLYNIEINIPLKNLPTLIIEGDSITAAWVTPESQGYGELIESECKGLCVKISGRGNGGIKNLIESQTPTIGRLATEVYPIKPDYTMVTIGTNDYGMVQSGEFKTFLEYLVDYICTEIKSVLILNHIPMNEREGGASVINDIIDEVISEKSQYNIRCIRFDVCTAINYDTSQGIDTSLFADAAHPNELGYKRMFEQAKIDVPELFYSIYK